MEKYVQVRGSEGMYSDIYPMYMLYHPSSYHWSLHLLGNLSIPNLRYQQSVRKHKPISFFSFGKFPSMNLLKMFSGPLCWELSLSSFLIFPRFCLFIVSWISWMLWVRRFLCFEFSLTVLSISSMVSSAPKILSSISYILLMILASLIPYLFPR